ncbi:MAG: sialate O-acetylesterase [Flavobacteriales bacterium]
MRLISIFLCLCLATTAFSKISLPPIIASQMVLQQNSVVKLWGSSNVKKSVTIKVSWTNTWFQTWTKPDGSWEIELFTPAGSFQEHWIKISDANDTKELQHVLIGEVWLCSGQSNMAMTYRGYKNQPIADAERFIAEANNTRGIRTFNVVKEASFNPKKVGEGNWLNASSANLLNFIVVGYTYALELQKTLQVPVGIINSSYGGSTIEGWLNAATLEKFSKTPIDKYIPDSLSYLRQTVFFQNMIRPIRNYKIKGVLWYQGEANSSQPQAYEQKLQDLIFLWRFTFSDTNLPFYLVEIAPHSYEHSSPTAAAELREAQSKAALSIPHCGIVCTSDLVPPALAGNIHPPYKQPIGQRLANLALAETYQQTRTQQAVYSPRFNHYEIANGQCILYFDNATDGFKTNPSTPYFEGFEIAEQAFPGRFIPVQAKLGPAPNTLVISLPTNDFGKLSAVRYCFKNYATATVFNSAGLPLFPFRTAIIE